MNIAPPLREALFNLKVVFIISPSAPFHTIAPPLPPRIVEPSGPVPLTVPNALLLVKLECSIVPL